MVPHTTRLPVSVLVVDRWLAQAVAQLSSSAAGRQTAAAWLAAHDSALGSGACEDEACARADDAYQVAAARLGLAARRQCVDRRAA